MPIEVEVPEIGIVEFPDDATESEISKALSSQFGGGTSAENEALRAEQRKAARTGAMAAFAGNVADIVGGSIEPIFGGPAAIIRQIEKGAIEAPLQLTGLVKPGEELALKPSALVGYKLPIAKIPEVKEPPIAETLPTFQKALVKAGVKIAKPVAGLENAAIDLAKFIASPEFLTYIGLGKAMQAASSIGKAGADTVAAYFAGTMLTQAPQEGLAALEAFKEGKVQEGFEKVGNFAAANLMGTAAGRHALEPVPTMKVPTPEEALERQAARQAVVGTLPSRVVSPVVGGPREVQLMAPPEIPAPEDMVTGEIPEPMRFARAARQPQVVFLEPPTEVPKPTFAPVPAPVEPGALRREIFPWERFMLPQNLPPEATQFTIRPGEPPPESQPGASVPVPPPKPITPAGVLPTEKGPEYAVPKQSPDALPVQPAPGGGKALAERIRETPEGAARTEAQPPAEKAGAEVAPSEKYDYEDYQPPPQNTARGILEAALDDRSHGDEATSAAAGEMWDTLEKSGFNFDQKLSDKEANLLYSKVESRANQIRGELDAAEPASTKAPKPPEKVVAAAIRINGEIVTGRDHAEAITKYAEAKGFDLDETWMEKHGEIDSGFLTDTGRFIDLDEAAALAGKSGRAGHAAEILAEPPKAPEPRPEVPVTPPIQNLLPPKNAEGFMERLPPESESIPFVPDDVTLARSLDTPKKRAVFKSNLTKAILEGEISEENRKQLRSSVFAYQSVWGKIDPLSDKAVEFILGKSKEVPPEAPPSLASSEPWKRKMYSGKPSKPTESLTDYSEKTELGPGKYWTDEPSIAKYFSGKEDMTGVETGTPNISKPLNFLGDWLKTPEFQRLSELLGDALPKWSDEKWNNISNPYNVLAKAAGGKGKLAELLRRAGYDGIVSRGVGGFGDLPVQVVELPKPSPAKAKEPEILWSSSEPKSGKANYFSNRKEDADAYAMGRESKQYSVSIKNPFDPETSTNKKLVSLFNRLGGIYEAPQKPAFIKALKEAGHDSVVGGETGYGGKSRWVVTYDAPSKSGSAVEAPAKPTTPAGWAEFYRRQLDDPNATKAQKAKAQRELKVLEAKETKVGTIAAESSRMNDAKALLEKLAEKHVAAILAGKEVPEKQQGIPYIVKTSEFVAELKKSGIPYPKLANGDVDFVAFKTWSKPIANAVLPKWRRALKTKKLPESATKLQKPATEPTPPPSTPKSEAQTSPGLIAGTAAEKWADERIKEQTKRTSALGLIDPEFLAAAAIKGAAFIERGIRDFAAWSLEMKKLYGPVIEKHLTDIYAAATQRLKEAGGEAVPTPAPAEKPAPAPSVGTRQPVIPETPKIVSRARLAEGFETIPKGNEAREMAYGKEVVDRHGTNYEAAWAEIRGIEDPRTKAIAEATLMARMAEGRKPGDPIDPLLVNLQERVGTAAKESWSAAGSRLQAQHPVIRIIEPYMAYYSWLGILRQKVANVVDPKFGPDTGQKIAEAYNQSGVDAATFRREFAKRVPLPNVGKADKVKLENALPEIMRLADMGLLDNEAFRRALGKEYGIEEMTGPTARKLMDLSTAYQKAPEGLQRDKVMLQMANTLADAADVKPWQLAQDYWYASVLFRVGTWLNVTVGSGTMSPTFALGMVFDRTVRGDPIGAMRLVQQLLSGFGEGALVGQQIARRGDYYLLHDFPARFRGVIEGTRKPDSLEALLRKGGILGNTIGRLAFTRRIMTGLDYQWAIGVRNAALAYSLMTRGDQAGLKALSRKWDAEANRQARDQAVRELGPGATRAELIVRRHQILEQGISEQSKEVASLIGQRTAQNAEPAGLGYYYYKVVNAMPFIAKSIAGQNFARATANMIQNASDAFPLLGMAQYTLGEIANYKLRKHGEGNIGEWKHFTSTPEEQRIRVALQGVSAMGALALAGLFLDRKDDKPPLFDINGPWFGVSPMEAKVLRGKGEIPQSIKILRKDGTYASIPFRNTPLLPMLSAIGWARDKQRFDPKKYKEMNVPSIMLKMGLAGFLSLKDVVGLSQIARIFNLQSGSTDKAEFELNRMFSQSLGRFAAGFIPSMVSELDQFTDPSIYQPTEAEMMGYWLRNVPFARKMVGQGPALDILGDPIAQTKPPFRQYLQSEHRNDKAWQVLNRAMEQGSFPTYAVDRQVVDEGVKRDMTEPEKYRYQKYFGKELRTAIEDNAETLLTFDRDQLNKWFHNTGYWEPRKALAARMAVTGK